MRRAFHNKQITIFGCLVLLILIVYAIHHLIYLKRSDDKSDFQNSDDMDVVYTWVNGTDEKFIEAITKYVAKVDPLRYEDRDELKYSLRSLEKFAPWARHVYIVTNGQIPTWLNLEYEKVSIVPHDQIAQDPAMLPTFSSNIIEQFIHRIPNLSKRFMYLNDDIFIGSELHPDYLYSPSEGFRIVTESGSPNCALYCQWSHLKDGICDKGCNVSECEFDGNDCIEGNEIRETEHKNITDMFTISLTNTIKAFNLAYGMKRRRYLPHMGFLIDKDIMEEMLMKFQTEFNRTRYKKLRTNDDMQVGYSYYHYVMSETRSLSADEIFDRFDLDKSETWSEDEIYLEDLVLDSLNKTSAEYFEGLVLNCFKNSSDLMDAEYAGSSFSVNSNSLKLTRNLVTKCSPLNETLAKRFSKENKYKFQYSKNSHAVSRYALLTSSMDKVRRNLNILRKNLKKFNCIGDYGYIKNNTLENRLKRKEALHNFYTGLFPNRSKFELPESGRNPYRYYDDYVEWKTSQQFKSNSNVIIVPILIVFILLFILKLNTCRKSS